MVYKGSFLFHFCFFLVFQAYCQNTTNINWYFGANDNSIRFTRPLLIPERVSLPVSLGTGGGAVATDPLKGNILFYTDGVSVYNQSHLLLNAGSPLDGSTTRNQGVAICHDPADPEGDDSRILIFTINDLGRISYSVFDKSASFSSIFPAPPDGAIISTNDITNLPNTTLSEGMIIIPNTSEDGFWLITHNIGTTTYNITQIDNGGINTLPIIDLPGTLTSAANLAFHTASSRISVSSATPGEVPLLLDFDRTTGFLLNSAIDLSPINAQGVYDMEWTTSGDSLFISGNFGAINDALIRVNLMATPIEVDTVLTNDVRSSLGLQYGADSALYHLYQSDTDGLFRLGRLENPDTTDITQVLYNPEAVVDINTGQTFDYDAQQFPAFLPTYDLLQTANFTSSGNCASVPVYFFPQIIPDISQIRWDFGDGVGFSNATNPAYTYTEGGTFTVQMVVTVNGVEQIVSNDIIVQDFELTLQIDPMQQYWCPSDFPVTFTASGDGAASASALFRWSNQTEAEANAVTSIDEPGTYYVVATDPATGCAAYMEQEVIEYGTINNFANAWYFGNNAGIDFNPFFDQDDPDFGTIQPISPGDPDFLGGNLINNGEEGYAIYCDQGGRPIVYSNGAEVYNRDNVQVTNALGGGAGATQSVYIVQNPTDATIYYIFFTQEVPNAAGSYDFLYAIFDLKLNSGAGDLVRNVSSNIITTTLFSCTSERITGNDSWVITHEWGNNNFRAYPITSFGVGSPVISNVGSIHSLVASGITAQGYMKLNGTRLGVALSQSMTENYVEVFDFDETTGAISENLVIDLSPQTGQIYGIEFTSENLFATLRNSDGGTKVLWWDFVDNTANPSTPRSEAEVNASVITIVDETGIDLGAMQTGPDGTIYIANDGAPNLAAINNPETEPTSSATGSAEVGYNLSAPPALGATSRLGLPNFVDFNGSSTPTASLEAGDGCQGDAVELTVLNPLDDPDREIENYLVIVFDPDGTQVFVAELDEEEDQQTASFSQTQTAGVYTVEFYIRNVCNSDIPQTILNFTINPLPEATIVSTDPPSACGSNDGSATVDFNVDGTATYSVTGPVAIPESIIIGNATGVVIPNLSAGQYTLNVASNTTGCANSFNFTINDPTAYTVALVEASPVNCNNQNGALSFSFDPAADAPPIYSWEIRNITTGAIETGDQTSPLPIEVASAGDFSITLIDGDGCTVADTATVTTPPLISVEVEAGPFAGCNDESVQIDITTNGTIEGELYEIIGATISNTLATNFTIIGANDSIRITNPDVGVAATYNYALVMPGALEGPCTNFTTLSISFGNSSPNPYTSRAVICPDEVIFERTFASFDNQPNGFQLVQWFAPDGREIIQTPGDTLSNIAGYTFSEDGTMINTFLTTPLRAVLTNLEGCTTEAEINIVEDCQARINAPTAFSPNGDNINDGFRLFPFLVDESDFQIFIFNRWGEMVFQSSDLLQMTEGDGWNGAYDNDLSKPLIGGMYAYKLTFKNAAKPDQEVQEQRGGIVIIR